MSKPIFSLIITALIFCSISSKFNSDQPIHVHIVPYIHFKSELSLPLNNSTPKNQTLFFNELYNQLVQSANRTLVIPQVLYFAPWYENLTNDTIKRTLQELCTRTLNKNKLEFVGGGWIENDESITNYDDIISQMINGNQFLLQNLGYQPIAAWAIDSFGHSSTNAYLYEQMGFQAIFMKNIDFKERYMRMNNTQMEFAWIPYLNYLSTKSSPIFSHVFYQDTEEIPQMQKINNFRFGDGDDESSYEDSLFRFVEFIQRMNPFYRTNQMFVPIDLGDEPSEISRYYEFMDMIIDKISNFTDNKMQAFYSLSADYFQIVNGKFDQIPSNLGDFEPFSDNFHSYWTGFYTSRPILKKAIREFSNQLSYLHKEASFIMFNQTITDPYKFQLMDSIKELEKFNSVLQGHNIAIGAISQNDTDFLLNMITIKQIEINKHLTSFYDQRKSSQQKYQICTILANQTKSQCPSLENILKSPIQIVVMNPSMANHNIIQIKLPSLIQNLTLFDQTAGIPFPADVLCLFEDPKQCSIYFQANFQSFEQRSYLLSVSNSAPKYTSYIKGNSYDIADSIYSSGKLFIQQLFHDRFMNTFTLKQHNATTSQIIHQIPLDIKYNYYSQFDLNDTSVLKQNTASTQDGGILIFRPSQPDLPAQEYSKLTDALSYKGNIFQCFCLTYGDKIKASIQLRGNVHLQINSYIQPIDVSDQIGKDILLSITTPFQNIENEFWTDSNGMALERRILNSRPNFSFSTNQTIAANFYPVTSSIVLKDTQSIGRGQISVFTDRAQGGAVLDPGCIELMVHRRLLTDDGKGVNQALNQTDSSGHGIKFNTMHLVQILFLDDQNAKQYQNRRVQRMLNEQLRVYIKESQQATSKHNNWLPITYLQNTTLNDIKITMRVINSQTIWVRLHNIKDWIDHSDDYNDDDTSDDVIKFNLSTFMKQFFDTSNGKQGASCKYQMYATPITLNGIVQFTDENVLIGCDSLIQDIWATMNPQEIRQFNVIFEEIPSIEII